MTGPGVDGLDDTARTARITPCSCGKYADRPYWPDWVEFTFLFLLVFAVMGAFTLLFLAFFSP